MDDKLLIARRVARELRPGSLVNLGIGLPTLVAGLVPKDAHIFFQSENGIVGMHAIPEEGLEAEDLTDAGGSPISAMPGSATFDSTFSFGLIRGGHLDVTVLGGLQVDARGRLANWMVPGKLVPGMGGAMDLVSGARRVIVAMTHTAKGVSKIVESCTLPVTSERRVDLVVTELAVLAPTVDGIVLKEVAPGVDVEQVQRSTGARLIVPAHVPCMDLGLGA
jgi:acetate CoA/acetoacetate CoA-transferase beta subunit